MNITRFNANLSAVLKTLENSAMLKEVRKSNFTNDKLAEVWTQVAQISANTAVQLEELELKEREIAMGEEKTRQELELAGINAKAQNKINLAEALKSVIQGHSMAKSIGQNAQINKANAMVGFLNVVGNAAEGAAIAQHTDAVVGVINSINTGEVSDYTPLLNALRDDIKNLMGSADGNKEVFIHVPKTTLEVGEEMRVLGVSSFGNNASKFIVDGVGYDGLKNVNIKKAESGEIEVEFYAQRDSGEWVGDKVIVSVVNSIG